MGRIARIVVFGQSIVVVEEEIVQGVTRRGGRVECMQPRVNQKWHTMNTVHLDRDTAALLYSRSSRDTSMLYSSTVLVWCVPFLLQYSTLRDVELGP